MLGYSEAELIGRTVKEISHLDDRDQTDAERARMRAGEVSSVQFEKRYLRKNDSVLWVNLTVALARNAQGEPQYEIAIMEDITERKEREATLQRFRTALDSSADMVFLFDLSAGGCSISTRAHASTSAIRARSCCGCAHGTSAPTPPAARCAPRPPSCRASPGAPTP